MEKVAVLGVVFPEVEKYLDSYLASLEKQTFNNFDLIIINDGLGDFEKYKDSCRLRINEIKYTNTPAKIREFAINYIKEKYHYAVFTDSDDFFADNRVEKSLELLQHYDIVVNDLTTVSGEGKVLSSNYLSNRITNLSEVKPDYIVDKNVFGLSNTAVRLRSCPERIQFNSNMVAVDWFFYAILLSRGCRAIFTSDTITYYRIYGGNAVGLGCRVTKTLIEKGIAVKLNHYEAMSGENKKMSELYQRYKEIQKKMAISDFKEKYLYDISKQCMDYPLWWEQIKLPEVLKYENTAFSPKRCL